MSLLSGYIREVTKQYFAILQPESPKRATCLYTPCYVFSKVRYASFTLRLILEDVMFCIGMICYLWIGYVIGIIHIYLTDNKNCIWFILNSPEMNNTSNLWGSFCYRKSVSRIGQTEGSWMIWAVGTSSEAFWFLSITDASKLFRKRLSKLHFLS